MSWELVLYPNGKENSNGSGHISLYLAIAATDVLPLGWGVNVDIRFFVFDQIRDKYLSIQGSFTEKLSLRLCFQFVHLDIYIYIYIYITR
jgi:hypothetical protein